MTKGYAATHAAGSLMFYILLCEKADKFMVVLYAVNDWTVCWINSLIFKESTCFTHMCAPSKLNAECGRLQLFIYVITMISRRSLI